MSKKILLVLTSHAQFGNTGKPTGYYLPEASVSAKIISDAGYEIDFVSPQGGPAPFVTGNEADPADEWFLNDSEIQHKVNHTLKPAEVDANQYSAIYYIGGHGTVWDFKDNAELQDITRKIWENNGVVAGVCHGPIGLINVKLSNGKYLVDGKKIASFSNAEEAAEGGVGVVPFFVADELAAHGGIISHADLWEANVIADGNFVTGQNPASAKGVSDEIVNLLK
ncbi:type 1 glutamine amidotransferase domain-containing protein [Mucilaginibacter sp. CAU 1740]|uniref:type 1 glutamine amidotransferase domain-containing protein n=1 Tax=Mucilaginibacter sp. CAU 1740 TaxID=3140365 RepID=UPI00325AAF8A